VCPIDLRVLISGQYIDSNLLFVKTGKQKPSLAKNTACYRS
jgi:hypothetical protein